MRRNATAGVILAALMLAGCSSTGTFGRERLALPIGPSYVGGRGVQVFPASESLVSNVKEAMSDVGIHAINQTQDPSGLIVLEGKTVDDRRARVTLLGTKARSTVSIKIGWVGDEPITRVLLDRIGNRQGTFEPSTPVEAPPEPAQPILSREAVPDSTMLRNQVDAGYNPSVVP